MSNNLKQFGLNWTTEKRKVSSLTDWSKNPRKINKDEFKALKDSVEARGFHDVLKVDVDGTIISGHQRKKVLKELGVDEITVMVPDRPLTEDEREVIALESNKHRGVFDYDILANEFGVDNILSSGFDESELGFLDIVPEESEQDEKIPETPTTPQTVLGDVYQLGEHRIMCGDSTDKDSVAKLMNGTLADLAFTSPPYNVGHNVGYKDKKSKYKNSDDNLVEYKKLITETTDIAMDNAKDVFVNLQILSNNKKDVLLWLADLVETFKDIFFWKKNTVQPAMASNVANSQTELILLFGKQNNSRSWGNKKFRGTFSNFIETESAAGENKNSKIHNATFPVNLPMRFIVEGYERGSKVLDLFMGTGTTMIAAEKTERIAYGMELDPAYVDVAVQRYCEFVGNNKIIKNGVETEWQSVSPEKVDKTKIEK